MAGLDILRRGIDEIKDNWTDLGWWHRRVIVPYLIGTISRYVPGYPGYEDAISVMEEDWDNLIILDACRADIFEEVADVDRFDCYSHRISKGSHSSEWTRRNFSGQQFGDTVYVTGNPHTKILAGDSFHDIVEIRSPSETENWMDAMVDAAVEAHARYPDKRLIVHFMQPHSPDHVDVDTRELDPEQYWRLYRESLALVLKHAFELIEDVGGRTVITADHGETFERRLLGIVPIQRHPPRVRLPELVWVPWATIDDDPRNVTSGETRRVAPSADVNEQLRNLGYRV